MAQNVGGIEYSIDAKTAPFLQAVQNVKAENKNLEGSFDKVDAKVKKFEQSLASLGARVTASGNVINAYGQVNKQLTDQYQSLNRELEINKQRQEAANATVARNIPQMTQTAKAVRGVTLNMQNLGYQIQDIAVMAQYGASPFLIFSTQISQLLGGPVGAMLGAFAAIAGGIALAASAADDAQESIEEMIERVTELSAAEKELLSIKLTDKLAEEDSAWAKAGARAYNARNDYLAAKKAYDAYVSGDSTGLLDRALGEDYFREKMEESRREMIESEAAEAKLAQAHAKTKSSLKALTDGTLEHAEALKKVKKEVQDITDDYELQAKMVGQSEREQAKLRAIAKLGAQATQEQKDEVLKSVDAYFDQKDAFDKTSESSKKYNQATKSNITLIERLRNQQGIAALSAQGLDREAAILTATQQLNSTATKEQREEVEQLAGSIYDLTQATKGQKDAEQKLNEAKSAISGSQAMTLGFGYTVDMTSLEAQHEAGLIAEEEYLASKLMLNQSYEEQLKAMQEERFRAESEWNELTMSGLDALGATASNVFGGMLSGTMSAKEALQAFSQAILNQAIGALVQMGVQYLKNQLIEKSAIAATTATAAAAGSAMAAAYAPAAAMASLASFGANAAAASTGITSTVALAQGLSFGGGRENGGPVSAGSYYRMGEGNKPEILQTSQGLFGIPGDKGRVFSNKELGEMSGGGSGVVININNAPEGTTVTQNGNTFDIDVAVQRAESNFVSQMNNKSGNMFEAIRTNTNMETRL